MEPRADLECGEGIRSKAWSSMRTGSHWRWPVPLHHSGDNLSNQGVTHGKKMSYGERMSCWHTASCPRLGSPVRTSLRQLKVWVSTLGTRGEGQERAQCPLCREKPKASEGLGARVRQEAKDTGGDAACNHRRQERRKPGAGEIPQHLRNKTEW